MKDNRLTHRDVERRVSQLARRVDVHPLIDQELHNGVRATQSGAVQRILTYRIGLLEVEAIMTLTASSASLSRVLVAIPDAGGKLRT